MKALRAALAAYPTLLRVGFAGALAYRAEMLVWMLTTTMPLVSLALWAAVAEVAPVGRFGAKDFVAYFLATLVVRQLTGSWLVWELNTDIKSGTLSQRLLKPMNPLVVYSAENLAALPLRALLCVPIAVVALAVLEPGRLAHGGAALGLCLLAIVGAWLINFFVMALCGTLAFVMESSTSIFEIYLAGFMLLSGYLVPLELFPPWLRGAADALPFRYTLSLPVELLTGLLSPADAAGDLAVQWLYVAGTAAAALVAFRAGVRRFAAYGG